MTDTSYFDRILQSLHKWDHLGYQQVPNGTLLIGRVPHVAPAAWLHEIYAPIGADQDEVLAHLPVPVHADYKAFLSRANGMYLFSGQLCIYGIRSSYERIGGAKWQPFDLRIPNTMERVPGAPSDAVFVGIDAVSQQPLAILSGTGETFRCQRDDPARLQSWNSFAEMLLSEIERLSLLCDSNGMVAE